MTVFEVLLRVVTLLHGLDLAAGLPGSATLPLVAVTVFGSAVAVAVVVLVRLVVVVLGFDGPLRRLVAADAADLATRITWSHPDADGHVRSRAPGAVRAV